MSKFGYCHQPVTVCIRGHIKGSGALSNYMIYIFQLSQSGGGTQDVGLTVKGLYVPEIWSYK